VKISPAFPKRALASLAMASFLLGCGGDGGNGNRAALGSPPGVRISSATVRESDGGTVDALFRVTLSRDPGDTVTVSWRTVDDTAVAGEDYRADSGTLVFGPDVTEDVIDIQVMGDAVDEADEDFAVVLSDAAGANIEDGRARGRIEDDDAAPITSGESKGKAKKKGKEPSRGEDSDEGDEEDSE
jgi:hypothetical protein